MIDKKIIYKVELIKPSYKELLDFVNDDFTGNLPRCVVYRNGTQHSLLQTVILADGDIVTIELYRVVNTKLYVDEDMNPIFTYTGIEEFNNRVQTLSCNTKTTYG